MNWGELANGDWWWVHGLDGFVGAALSAAVTGGVVVVTLRHERKQAKTDRDEERRQWDEERVQRDEERAAAKVEEIRRHVVEVSGLAGRLYAGVNPLWPSDDRRVRADHHALRSLVRRTCFLTEQSNPGFSSRMDEVMTGLGMAADTAFASWNAYSDVERDEYRLCAASLLAGADMFLTRPEFFEGHEPGTYPEANDLLALGRALIENPGGRL